MNNQTVWLLYEESGEYSDYRMGILGIFSSVENAKAWFENYCKQQVENPLIDWSQISSWRCKTGKIEHCRYPSSAKYRTNYMWTIMPYIVDAL